MAQDRENLERRIRLGVDGRFALIAVLAAFVIVLLESATAISALPRLSVANVGVSSGQTLSGSLPWTASVIGGTADRVVFSIDGTDLWTEHYIPYVFNGDGNALDTSRLAGGTHTFTVTAYPSSGTSDAVSSSVTATVARPMEVSMAGIAAGQTLTGTVSWIGQVGQVIPNRVSFSIDGTVRSTDPTYPYTYALDTTSLSNGEHTFTVSAYPGTDLSGAVSSSVAATVANTAPITSPIAPDPGPPFGLWAWDAAGASVDPGSASKIASFQSYAVGAGTYFEATVAWANASAGTPSYSIPITGQVVRSITAPVPVGTRPGSTFDQSLTVHGADGTDYDFGLAQYDGSTGKIKSTDGAAIVAPGAAYETGPGSGNAARFPLRAGAITPADIKAGVINHALQFTMPNAGPAPSPYPANTTVGYPGNTGIPLGTWLRLDPSVNVAAQGLPPLEAEIAVALQRYGMFLRDIGSTLCIVATDQVNQGGNAVDWPAVGVTLTSKTPAGVPYARGLSPKFPWSKLQVLLPPSH